MIETGRVRPSWYSLDVIARAVGVPITRFLIGRLRPGAVPTEPLHRNLENLCQQHRYTDVVDAADTMLRGGASPRHLAVAHLYLGRAYCQMSRPDDALAHLEQARGLFEALSDPWGAAEAIDWEASATYLKQDGRRAVEMSKEALRQYRRLEPRRPEVESRLLEHLGAFLLRRGAYDPAQSCYEEAREVAGNLVDLTRLARIYHGLSYCRWHLADPVGAIELAEKAVVLSSVEHDLTSDPARVTLAKVENDLGMMLMRQGHLGRAEKYFLSALEHLATDWESVRSQILLSLAELRQRQDRVEEAFVLIARAMDQGRRLGDPVCLAIAHRRLADLHTATGDYGRAEAQFREALRIVEQAGLDDRRPEFEEAYSRLLARSQRAGAGPG